MPGTGPLACHSESFAALKDQLREESHSPRGILRCAQNDKAENWALQKTYPRKNPRPYNDRVTLPAGAIVRAGIVRLLRRDFLERRFKLDALLGAHDAHNDVIYHSYDGNGKSFDEGPEADLTEGGGGEGDVEDEDPA